MPIRGSVDSTFTVRAFNIVRGALAASGVASNQPAWRYFSTPWSTFRPVFRVPDVGYRANEVLGPSSTHALGMFDAVVRPAVYLIKRSSTCRERDSRKSMRPLFPKPELLTYILPIEFDPPA